VCSSDLSGRVLDIGCGDGRFCTLARNRCTAIVGVDCALKALGIARQRNIPVVQSNFGEHKLPFADASFDVVTCLDVIEHIFDPFFLLKEINRVLKPGGELILTTPNLRYIKHVFDLLLRGQAPKTNCDHASCDGGHLHYFCCKDLEQLLQECGMGVTVRRGVRQSQYRSFKLWLFKLVARLWEKEVEREFFYQGILVKAGKP
jgi:methionine biosynthesis protein MetW